MSIGYACLAIGVRGADFKTCRQNHASEEKLAELIAHNLTSLANIIKYNINYGIRLFRITSDIIPFGSSPVNTLLWQEQFKPQLGALGRHIRESGIRISMHPGQYTVLNSPDGYVVERAAEDLRYHARFLDSLGTGPECKIILHIGGAYGDKRAAMDRFARRYHELEDSVRRRLVIENDERTFHIGDTLELGARLGIPVVYDALHDAVNPCDSTKRPEDWITEAKKTWRMPDGSQKIHYSQQAPGKKPGSHSETLRIDEFIRFYESLGEPKPNIMLEVKDKNLSAVRCINALGQPSP